MTPGVMSELGAKAKMPTRILLADLLKRADAEWAAAIQSVANEKVRAYACATVWWDLHVEALYSEMMACDREFTPAPAELEAALMVLGYPAEFAKRRATPAKSSLVVDSKRMAEHRARRRYTNRRRTD